MHCDAQVELHSERVWPSPPLPLEAPASTDGAHRTDRRLSTSDKLDVLITSILKIASLGQQSASTGTQSSFVTHAKKRSGHENPEHCPSELVSGEHIVILLQSFWLGPEPQAELTQTRTKVEIKTEGFI
jgi:hypothetical protein